MKCKREKTDYTSLIKLPEKIRVAIAQSVRDKSGWGTYDATETPLGYGYWDVHTIKSDIIIRITGSLYIIVPAAEIDALISLLLL